MSVYSYNLKTEVTLINIINERYGVVYARPGELFARVPLADQLNDDTDAGKLLNDNMDTGRLVE